MSMTLAFSIPGIAVVAAERNVTITDATGECILEGCRKLVELSNGFAVGAGPIAGASAALAAMSGGGPVTPTRFNECADAADMLYPQGGIQLAAIVNTPEGVRILKSAAVDGVHRQTRRRQVIEFTVRRRRHGAGHGSGRVQRVRAARRRHSDRRPHRPLLRGRGEAQPLRQPDRGHRRADTFAPLLLHRRL